MFEALSKEPKTVIEPIQKIRQAVTKPTAGFSLVLLLFGSFEIIISPMELSLSSSLKNIPISTPATIDTTHIRASVFVSRETRPPAAAKTVQKPRQTISLEEILSSPVSVTASEEHFLIKSPRTLPIITVRVLIKTPKYANIYCHLRNILSLDFVCVNLIWPINYVKILLVITLIEILYEDKDIVAAVKPAGISSENEMPELLKTQINSSVYTLHRLDKPVGGVMVYAKNKTAAAKMSKKISENSDFSKTYLLVCEGTFEEKEADMEDLLFKDSAKNKSFVVKKERKGVKKASLTYSVIKEAVFKEKMCSLVSVTLKTGRSHQIRVQFASRKHPLAGDGKYGSKLNCPIALFSHKIETMGMAFTKKPLYEEIPWCVF